MPYNALPLNWRKFPERYNLEGSYCETCDTYYFPARVLCHKCRRKGKIIIKEMPRIGTIISYTKVHVGPKGFEYETPYHLALVDLGKGVKLLTQIVDSEDAKIGIGAKVKKVFRKINEGSKIGPISYGYKFKVIK
ncbi:MAG: Zn-ribbon domain-containing OB-fold protein [archaeon]